MCTRWPVIASRATLGFVSESRATDVESGAVRAMTRRCRTFEASSAATLGTPVWPPNPSKCQQNTKYVVPLDISGLLKKTTRR